MGREEGGGFRMGSTGIPVADSFRCLAKLIHIVKFKNKKKIKSASVAYLNWITVNIKNTPNQQCKLGPEKAPVLNFNTGGNPSSHTVLLYPHQLRWNCVSKSCPVNLLLSICHKASYLICIQPSPLIKVTSNISFVLNQRKAKFSVTRGNAGCYGFTFFKNFIFGCTGSLLLLGLSSSCSEDGLLRS